MAGGSAGQFLVGPVMTAGMPWNTFWFDHGIGGHRRSPSCCSCCCRSATRGRDRPSDEAGQTEVALVEGRGSCLGQRVSQSAVVVMRVDRRTDVRSHHDLRHGVGRAVHTGRFRSRFPDRRHAIGGRAVRLDHRMSVAWLGLGSHRSAQAGHPGRRGGAARWNGADPLWPGRRISTVRARPRRRHRFRRGDVDLHASSRKRIVPSTAARRRAS